MGWLHIEQKSDGPHPFVSDSSVCADLRRAGYGRAITRAAEHQCRERGVVTFGLNVFGHNVAA